MEQQIKALRKALVKAKPVAALTGAGISAESGVPNFRGADGLWRNYNDVELATPHAFARDPERVWEYYNWRRNLITDLTFDPGIMDLVPMRKSGEILPRLVEQWT